MSNDVLITPASRKIEFKDSSANVDAKIETDASGNLVITNTGGDISIGDTTSDIFVGDGTNNIDIVFEQDGEIRGTSGVTVTLGQSDSNVRMATDLNLNSNDITNAGSITATSFSDGTISGITFIDEDSFATNSATRVPTQQSIKAYVDAQVAGVVDSAPAALDTLNELAAALGDDANFSTTTSTALGNRLRVDTAAQGLTGTQQANAITNLGITATKAELNYVDGVTSNIQTQLNGKQASGSYLTGNQTITLSGDVSGSGTTSIAVTIADDSHNHVISNVDGLQTALDAKLASSSYTAADVLTKIKTVDGAGSGLDADLLDGISSGSFLRSDAADSWNIGRVTVYVENNSSDNSSGAGITLRTSLNPSSGDPASVGNIFAIRSSGQALRFAVGQSITSTGDNDFTTNDLTANGNITVTGTVDGRDIASDGSKLDGIESGATADQTLGDLGVTSTAAELNKLDGYTGSVTELNYLDTLHATGVTSTEFDYLDGVTSNIQTQLNGKQASGSYLTGNQTITLSGDASGSGTTSIAVTVANDSHNHSSSSGDFTVNGGNIFTGTSQQRVKIGVWSNTVYGIGMGAGYTFGGIASEYVLSNQMSDTNGRGFWWGDSGHSNAQGAMALTTQGYLTVANRIRVGYGESDTTTPSKDLDVSGDASIGSLMVGATATPAMQLQVKDTTNYHGILVNGNAAPSVCFDTSTGTTPEWKVGISGNNATKFAISKGTANDDKLTIDSSGNAAVSGNVTAYSSDERLKTNITPIENPIEKVKQLNGVEFDWKDNVEELGFTPRVKHETGVIAQNVQSVIPDATPNAPFNEEYLTVQHEKIIPVLIEAIKEQQKQIDDLKQQINEQKEIK